MGGKKIALAGMLSKNTSDRFSHGAATATEAGITKEARAQRRQHQAAPSQTGGFPEKCRTLDVHTIRTAYHAFVHVYRGRHCASVQLAPP
jgi:hypothetical protein